MYRQRLPFPLSAGLSPETTSVWKETHNKVFFHLWLHDFFLRYVGTWRRNDVVLTLIRRQSRRINISKTSLRRHVPAWVGIYSNMNKCSPLRANYFFLELIPFRSAILNKQWQWVAFSERYHKCIILTCDLANVAFCYYWNKQMIYCFYHSNMAFLLLLLFFHFYLFF